MKTTDQISNIRDIGIMLQSMINSRFNIKVPVLYGKGQYKNATLTFYRHKIYQLYVQDKHNYYMVYLLKNNVVIYKDIIKNDETIEMFYRKINRFFAKIN